MEQLWSFILLVMEQRSELIVQSSCHGTVWIDNTSRHETALNRSHSMSWNTSESFILYVKQTKKKSWRILQDFFSWRFFFMQNQKNEDVTSFDRSSTSSKVNRSFAEASFDRVVSFASIATHRRTWKTFSWKCRLDAFKPQGAT